MSISSESLVADLQLDGASVRASLSARGVLSWTGASSGSLVLKDDVLGFRAGASTILLHTFRIRPGSCLGSKGRVQKDLNLDFKNPLAHNEWCTSLQAHFEASNRPRKLLVLVNPFGGKGSAKKIYAKKVLPLFNTAQIEVKVIETQYYKHAIEIARELDLSSCDGVVCVSGDGIPVEVLNGFLSRPDWDKAIRMPIGLIPAGSGNGVAKSLLEEAGEPFDVASATFAIICGRTKKVDVTTIRQDERVFHGMLNVYWGLTADADLESEKYRFLGGARITLQALVRMIFLRKYRAKLSYIPASGSSATEQRIHVRRGSEDLQSVNLLDAGQGGQYEKDSLPGAFNDGTPGYKGPQLPAAEWTTSTGEFLMVWLQNFRWASYDLCSHPRAKMSDGYLDCLLVRPMKRLTLLLNFLKMEKGQHLDKPNPAIESFKVLALRMEPGTEVKKGHGSYVGCDGEILARGQGTVGAPTKDPMVYGPYIEFSVTQGMATLYSL